MELFNTEIIINLLPYDGEVNYYGKMMDKQHADHYLDKLLSNIAWKNDEAIIFGRHIITKRKVPGMAMRVTLTLIRVQHGMHCPGQRNYWS